MIHTKLKDEARRFEQQEDWDRAIQLYLRALRGAEEGENEIELPLYNRIGDLYLRLGKPKDAVTYYEQAADSYAEAGLYNNAIALCNKALRYAPGRMPLVRKLGRFCALQGFITDARRWFLMYAERMFAQGAADDALHALEDFANISEDVEVRELLARHLHAHARSAEALIEFRRAYGMRLAAGDAFGAESLKAEVLALYPEQDDLTPEPLQPPSAEKDAAQEEERGEGRLPGLAEATRVAAPSADDVGSAAAGDEAEASTDPHLFMQAAGRATQPADSGDAPPTVETLAALQSTYAEEATPLPGFESTSLADDEPTALAEGEAASVSDDEPAAAPDPSLAALRAAYAETVEDTESPDEESADAAPLPFLEPPPAEHSPGLLDTGRFDAVPGREGADGGSRLAASTDAYVDLLALIDPNEGRPTDTRFVVEEKEPTGDEDRDFAELLAQFKAKLNEAVDPDDAASHYDLGLAFKEMGLLDEAISAFQRSMRAGESRLKILEELGQCFIMKRQHNVAVRMLQTALKLEHGDDVELIGVYYHLGRAYEELGRTDDARDAYEQVIGLDITFQDAAERIVRL